MTRQISSCYRLLITLSFFLCAAASLPAAAGQPVKDGPDGRPSLTVTFGDLDLNTDAGKRELLNRLSKAASRVCFESAKSDATLGMPAAQVSCYRHTLAAAVEKVQKEQVSALSAARSHPNTR